MSTVNYKLLNEDVKFPLKWDSEDYKMYIFDSEDNMIAQVNRKLWNGEVDGHQFEALIGEMKTIEPNDNPTYRLYKQDFYPLEGEKKSFAIGCVRGWGRLQYKNNPELRQDNIANYILGVLNNTKDE